MRYFLYTGPVHEAGTQTIRVVSPCRLKFAVSWYNYRRYKCDDFSRYSVATLRVLHYSRVNCIGVKHDTPVEYYVRINNNVHILCRRSVGTNIGFFFPGPTALRGRLMTYSIIVVVASRSDRPVALKRHGETTISSV